MSTVKPKKHYICPACTKPVTHDEHHLRLQLVNAGDGAPKENTDLEGMFHHLCAAKVWNAAKASWFGAA